MTDFDKNTQNDLPDDLAQFFAAAKQEPIDLPPGVMGRILQDAGQVQDGFSVGLADRPAKAGLFNGIRDLLGGWPAMAGLMTACTAGVWLGFSPPNMLPDAFVISSLTQENIDVLDANGIETSWLDDSGSLVSQ